MGKTLLWTIKHFNVSPTLKKNIVFVGAVHFGDLMKACGILEEGDIMPSALMACRSLLTVKDFEMTDDSLTVILISVSSLALMVFCYEKKLVNKLRKICEYMLLVFIGCCLSQYL